MKLKDVVQTDKLVGTEMRVKREKRTEWLVFKVLILEFVGCGK